MPERTVEELVAAVGAIGRDNDHIGWLGDRRVAETDGTIRFERRPDGSVEVSTWSRGKRFAVESHPSEDAAVRAAAGYWPEVERRWSVEDGRA